MNNQPEVPPAIAPQPDSAVPGLDGFTHRYADVNGTRIHYVVGGKGPAVALLHGFPFTWAIWQRLMPKLAEAGYTVIAPDLRAMGDSAPAQDGFAKTNVAEDIRQIVTSLGFASINLVGMDIGTMVAYAYASRTPEQVDRLVLSESLLPGFGLEELMNPATGGFWHFGFQAQVDLATMLTQGKEAAYLSPYYQMMSALPDGAQIAQSTYLPHYVGERGLRGPFQHYEPLVADGKANRADFAGKLPMPVLVLNAERGLPQAPLLAGVQQVAERIETDIVPNSGHTIGQDNPDWLAERLARFFA